MTRPHLREILRSADEAVVFFIESDDEVGGCCLRVFLIPPPPGVWPRVPCAPPPNAAPANGRLRPAARSAFGVQNLRRGALHTAVRAEQAAVAGLGAQHLVATPALAGQECRHGGHHHFPLRSAYRAGQDRNLDGSASHCAVDPRQECVTGAPLNPLWRRGVNHAVHHVRIFSLPLLPWFRPGRGSQSEA